MNSARHGGAGVRIPSRAALYFLAPTFFITWGVIGVYLLAPGRAADWFGAISGSHPLFFLATWAPAIAAFVLILAHGGKSGLRRFLSRLLIWRAPIRWIAFILFALPLVFVAGSLIKGGSVLVLRV